MNRLRTYTGRLLFTVFIILPIFSALPFVKENVIPKNYSLDDLLKIGLENNHKIKASRLGINIAESRVKQAHSAYYPEISASAAYSLVDENPLFVIPSFNFPPLQIPGFNIGEISIPQQDIKLMDKQNVNASLKLTYPLYTGGKISSINDQAKLGTAIAAADLTKTDLEVRYDIKRFYYAHVLSKKLLTIADDTYQKLEATLSLTESLYQNGSGSVTKVDYLKNKIIKDQVGTVLLEFRKNVKITKDALTFSVGLQLNSEYEIADTELPFNTGLKDIENLVESIFKNNPDWQKVLLANEIYKFKIDEAESGYYPNIGIVGSLFQNINSYEYGITNKTNSTMWMIGLGMEISLFSGFRTDAEAEEAEYEMEKLREEKNFLHDALILQLNQAYYNITTAEETVKNCLLSKQNAEENRILNEKAFEKDLVTVNSLLESQIIEAVISVQYYKSLYDLIDQCYRLELITGSTLYTGAGK